MVKRKPKMNPLMNYVNMLNNSKFFAGVVMIMLNIGARFIIDELDDDLRKTISKNYRKIFNY